MHKQPEKEPPDQLEKIQEWFVYFWRNADEKHKNWMDIQLQRQFPEYNRWLNNQAKQQ